MGRWREVESRDQGSGGIGEEQGEQDFCGEKVKAKAGEGGREVSLAVAPMRQGCGLGARCPK